MRFRSKCAIRCELGLIINLFAIIVILDSLVLIRTIVIIICTVVIGKIAVLQIKTKLRFSKFIEINFRFLLLVLLFE